MWYLLATKERVLFCFAQIPPTQVLHCFWAIWPVCIPNWYKTEFAKCQTPRTVSLLNTYKYSL